MQDFFLFCSSAANLLGGRGFSGYCPHWLMSFWLTAQCPGRETRETENKKTNNLVNYVNSLISSFNVIGFGEFYSFSNSCFFLLLRSFVLILSTQIRVPDILPSVIAEIDEMKRPNQLCWNETVGPSPVYPQFRKCHSSRLATLRSWATDELLTCVKRLVSPRIIIVTSLRGRTPWIKTNGLIVIKLQFVPLMF